ELLPWSCPLMLLENWLEQRAGGEPNCRISHWTVTSARCWEPKIMSTSSSMTPIAPDPEGIINQGHGNSAARAIQVHKGEPIKKRALLNLFKAVIANNLFHERALPTRPVTDCAASSASRRLGATGIGELASLPLSF